MDEKQVKSVVKEALDNRLATVFGTLERAGIIAWFCVGMVHLMMSAGTTDPINVLVQVLDVLGAVVFVRKFFMCVK